MRIAAVLLLLAVVSCAPPPHDHAPPPVDRDVIGTTTFYDSDEDSETEYRMIVETLGNTDHQTFYKQDGFEFRLEEEQVPRGHLFLMSDNRSAVGFDSRYFGAVEPRHCLGTLFMRWTPADDGGADLGHGFMDILD